MTWTPEHLETLVDKTLQTRDDEITCDEWVERVGAYVEALARDGAIPAALEVVDQHVKICPHCAEELEALRQALDLPATTP